MYADDIPLQPLAERDDVIAAILQSPAFAPFFAQQPSRLLSGLPPPPPLAAGTTTAAATPPATTQFTALLTTPGIGKSRLLHEFCAHPLVRAAASRRMLDILPLHISFSARTPIAGYDLRAIEQELVLRILLDASACDRLDSETRQDLYIPDISLATAVAVWIKMRAHRPVPWRPRHRDVVIVMCVDTINYVNVRCCCCCFLEILLIRYDRRSVMLFPSRASALCSDQCTQT